MQIKLPAWRSIPWPFVASFLLWIIMFRPFLANELALVHDAIQYYLSIEFYLANLSRGVYPLWDPTWFNGVAWDFFLRRIGNYNPLFYVMLLANKVGLDFLLAYLWFTAGYYFLGMVGFYLLARRILHDAHAAFLAFLLLMFSSLSTMLFFSYIQLIFVPYFWFFYFFVAFTQEPRKIHAVGLTFCAMVILNTYIPFYFVTIFLSFVILFVIFYAGALPRILRRYLDFTRRHSAVAVLCVVCILLSAVPGLRLYKHASTGEMVLPARQQEAAGGNIFTVSDRNIVGGDITSQLYFDKLAGNHDEIQLGAVYVPVFAYCLLLLGLAVRLSKKMAFLTVWAFLIFMIGLTTATPLYEILTRHVFYFKFIRQSYYFFWVLVLPVLILILSEQAGQLLRLEFRGRKSRYLASGYLWLAHIGLAIFLATKPGVAVSSYVVVGLSLFFWQTLLFQTGRRLVTPGRLSWILILLVALQPLEVYSYLKDNAEKSSWRSKIDTTLAFEYQFSYPKEIMDSEGLSIRSAIYYSSNWFNRLYNAVDPEVLTDYRRNRFIIYDRAQTVSDEQALAEFESAWVNRKNAAAIASPASPPPITGGTASTPMVIEGDSNEFKIMAYDVNGVTVRTDFSRPRFLVYNDAYHSGWRASIDGERVPILRANVAYKGIWLPAGLHNVTFRFLDPAAYWLEYFYVVLFLGVFICLIILAIKERPRQHDEIVV